MKIDSYSFGKVVIDGKTYTSDIIIYPEKVDPSWWRKEGHVLQLEDLPQALVAKPDMLIIGTGAYGVMRVPQDVVDRIVDQGIEVIVQRTSPAVDTFNAMRSAKVVIAALHLTC
jgi:hypothetical protein